MIVSPDCQPIVPVITPKYLTVEAPPTEKHRRILPRPYGCTFPLKSPAVGFEPPLMGRRQQSYGCLTLQLAQSKEHRQWFHSYLFIYIYIYIYICIYLRVCVYIVDIVYDSRAIVRHSHRSLLARSFKNAQIGERCGSRRYGGNAEKELVEKQG